MSAVNTISELPPWLAEFAPLSGDAVVSTDPLGFPGYPAQLVRAAARSGADESVRCGHAEVAGVPVVAISFEFAFMGGSMGEAAGSRIAAAIDVAARERLTLVTSTASGGARMQEGMRSLVQMQVVARALARLRASGAAHVAVAMDPTTGGVWASLVAAADVVIGREGATVAFAGARVRGTTERSEAFTAEGKLASGGIDQLVPEDALASAVAQYVRVFAAARRAAPVAPAPPAGLSGAERSGTGWEVVGLARHCARPRADAYIAAYFDETVTLSGDRAGGRDAGMRCGVGIRDGSAMVFIAQRGTANTPAGFRTAIRALRLAEQWDMPILTLIDTPGSANDALAEEQGIGSAIAQTFGAFADARVPITSLLIGEGGSGGALAIAAPANLWAVPASYFSVIAPEGAAAILHRDVGRAADLAGVLRLAPADLLELGVIRGIVTAGLERNRA